MSKNHHKHNEHLAEEREGHKKYGKVDSTTHKGPQEDLGLSADEELTAGKGPEPHPIAEKAYFSGAVDSKRGKLNAVPSENQAEEAQKSFQHQYQPQNRPTPGSAPRPKPGSSAPKPRPAGM